MTVAISSVTSACLNLAKATEALLSRKSPARTAILLPKHVFADGEDLRVIELSIISSCSNEAVCISSVISARRFWEGRMSESSEEESTSVEDTNSELATGEEGLISESIVDGEMESLSLEDVDSRDCFGPLRATEVARDMSKTISGRMRFPSDCV